MGGFPGAMEEPKVIIEQRLLHGSGDNGGAQRIALVYIGPNEHRVYAPPRATGDPAQWRSQLVVHLPSGYGELSMREPDRSYIIDVMFRELERSKGEAAKAEAAKAEAEALYYNAQICMQGDIQCCDGTPFDPSGHCTKCGSKCIHQCLSCKSPIRGLVKFSAGKYDCPSFCPGCGKPYPWMDDKLRTAKDLLHHAQELSYEERTELSGLLQYVMSNPKADLAPAKSKLISIKIQKVAGPIKDLVTDLLVKYAAEMSKP
jgi:hypothetical protein